MKKRFELCAESLESALSAMRGGADRIELCEELSIGGMTPNEALIRCVLQAVSIPVHVLIRPRGGDFCYTSVEFETMRQQIEWLKVAGAPGVVVGVLLHDRRVDIRRSRELVELARPMKVTFHRAFDETPNLVEALEAVIETGADCLLTSGGEPNVLEGATALARLLGQARARIEIMAGGGLTLANMVEVLERSGVGYLHGSLRRRGPAGGREAIDQREPNNSAALLEADVRTAVKLLRAHSTKGIVPLPARAGASHLPSDSSTTASTCATIGDMQSFPHEMLREIYEQPEALNRTLALYLDGAALRRDTAERLVGWANPAGEVLIAASGSSRHSGLAAEVLLEDLCGLAVDVEYSSEYSCRVATDLRRPAVIVISQSGETSDTLAALREVHRRGDRTLAITNAAHSTMAREADVSMPLAAGVEKAIPATKSFTCQLAVLYLLALYEAQRTGRMNAAELAVSIERLRALPGAIGEQLEGWREQMADLARKYGTANTFLFLGRGIHYAIAREGALKLKEASYVHAEGYPTGELKHGPNALVSDRVPLVVLATVDRALESSVLRYEKTLQLLDEMKAQGARVIAIANTGDAQVAGLVSDCVEVEPANEYLLPIVEVVPLQLFAYFMALEHGVDVDRPRNLSKAVVEL